MTLVTTHAMPSDLDQLLVGGLRELDITSVERDAVVQRYEELGVVLDELWASTRGANKVFAQGSFMLGTVVRNVNRNDDIDIDLVAVRDIAKASISQEELKDEVGSAVRLYATRAVSDFPEVEESSRCWTLTWPGMHMDVLPAIPNTEAAGDNLLITDKDVHRWLPSNPLGYAEWFRTQARRRLMASHEMEEKRLEVQQVPEWRQRSVLQRAVQALKRHRDIHFSDRPDQRPSSIVLTTLAAHAYRGGTDLHQVLRQIVASMPEHLHEEAGHWSLPNPAQPNENFTEYWATEPQRAARFFEWLDAAATTFSGLETKSGLDQTIPFLKEAFGSRFATGAVQTLAGDLRNARDDGSLRLHTNSGLRVAPDSATTRRVRGHSFAGGPR
ncbi:nucleotidyltransferase (plasmid) [Rhodococcus pyridinivorans]|uniref:nucleotidyltransferase domain-containing protein n=1 Tax=Rhodococcus pyridinivorans TaxID=103816 RepID=UPI00200B9869|nr:nucleotidyltransferase [Rhodococcus pyridinivorans]UPW06903.1 nucleotidyltransferase [Rhodococcus pyridinivorans]